MQENYRTPDIVEDQNKRVNIFFIRFLITLNFSAFKIRHLQTDYDVS